VQYLSTFFRKSLKRPSGEVSLKDEIEHVDAYLHIELARFAGRLNVQIDVPESLLNVRLPAFTLQPIVENAIKYGTSQLMEPGRVRIGAAREGNELRLSVEDNAGLYQPREKCDGLGMNLVDRRIKLRYGNQYGLGVECEPDRLTRVTIRLPMEEAC
jgi:two-component system LytT family sensor kinase